MLRPPPPAALATHWGGLWPRASGGRPDASARPCGQHEPPRRLAAMRSRRSSSSSQAEALGCPATPRALSPPFPCHSLFPVLLSSQICLPCGSLPWPPQASRGVLRLPSAPSPLWLLAATRRVCLPLGPHTHRRGQSGRQTRRAAVTTHRGPAPGRLHAVGGATASGGRRAARSSFSPNGCFCLRSGLGRGAGPLRPVLQPGPVLHRGFQDLRSGGCP